MKNKNKPGLFERLEKRFEHISKKYDVLMHKKGLAERFWNADFTQGSIAFGKKAIASLFRHVLPKRFRGISILLLKTFGYRKDSRICQYALCMVWR